MITARILFALALVPATASADKTYLKETAATHDCDKEPVVEINSPSGTFTLTGTCTRVGINSNKGTVTIAAVKKLGVNGNHNTVTVATVEKLGVNGNHNTVKAASVGNVGVNGNDNTVWYKAGAKGKPKPGVGIAGRNNKVAKQTL